MRPLFALSLLLAGCGGGTSQGGDAGHDLAVAGDGPAAPDLANPSDGGRAPLYHRPDDSACAGQPPAGNCMLQQAACMKDADCNAGSNGRCIQTMGGALTCRCSYDTCTGDGDCAAGQLCVCHGTPYTGGAGNTCVMGNCRVDADCGAGGFCSPSHGTSGCGGIVGYYCHTPMDTCLDDDDCQSRGGFQVCAFVDGDRRWKCVMPQLCP
jgi:hypothetical protein